MLFGLKLKMLQDTSPQNTELELSVDSPKRISQIPALLEQLNLSILNLTNAARSFEDIIRSGTKSLLPLFNSWRHTYRGPGILRKIQELDAIPEHSGGNAGRSSLSPRNTRSLSLKRGRNKKLIPTPI
jgi:hypothetical protein